MLICPKCGSIAEYSSYYGRVICTNSKCTWSECVDKIQKETKNDFIQPIRVEKDEKKMNEMLTYYYVEYINDDSKLLQANCIYNLIEKLLKQEGEFTPFVEKCYCAFTKSSVSELVQFYNHFGTDLISKISEFDNLNIVYGKEIKEC